MAKGASMKELDLTLFLEENETPNTRAYTHALDLAYLFVDEMERQGLSKKELAEKMGIGQSRLSNLLNTQPNMTLETIAQFELALGVDLTFTLEKDNGAQFEASTIMRGLNFTGFPESIHSAQILELTAKEPEGQSRVTRKLEVAA